MEKVYVQVDSKKLESGEVVPVRVNWEDGRFWDVDRVIHSCKSLEKEYDKAGNIQNNEILGDHISEPKEYKV